MPYNIFGEWIEPKKVIESANQPVKVRLVKRGKNELTVILNLNRSPRELAGIASSLKRDLGCGGTIREGEIEIQGNQVEAIRQRLNAMGIKTS